MKVGREQIAGLVAAIDRYLRDPGADERPGIAELAVAATALEQEPLLHVERLHDDALDVPTLHLGVDDVDAVIGHLASTPQPVVLGESEAWRGVLTVNPMALRPGDGALLAEAVIAAVHANSTHQAREQEQ
jgi:L-seryl-tRNA(Ser) seleniumtransferase